MQKKKKKKKKKKNSFRISGELIIEYKVKN